MFTLKKILLVSKPSSNNNTGQHVPPPRPAPPVVQHAPLIDRNDYKDEPDSPPSPVIPQNPGDSASPTEFDFLNLGGEKPPVPEPPKIAKIKEPSFDLLGGFDSNFSDPFPDLVGSAMNKPTEPIQTRSSANGLDDLFGSLPPSAAPTIVPSKSSSDLNGLNLNFGGSVPQPKQHEAPKDPFADLAKTLHPEWSTGPTKTTPSPMGTQYSTPQHQFGAQASSSASGTPQNNPSTPIHQMKSPSDPQRPDYSRSHFQAPQDPQGSAPKSKSADIFGDILGSQGYSFGSKTSQGPKSINDMRKVEMAQTMDPERLKVMEWVRVGNCLCVIKC